MTINYFFINSEYTINVYTINILKYIFNVELIWLMLLNIPLKRFVKENVYLLSYVKIKILYIISVSKFLPLEIDRSWYIIK